jgi:3-hydroxyacyl-CoA dehydrogenase
MDFPQTIGVIGAGVMGNGIAQARPTARHDGLRRAAHL